MCPLSKGIAIDLPQADHADGSPCEAETISTRDPCDLGLKKCGNFDRSLAEYPHC